MVQLLTTGQGKLTRNTGPVTLNGAGRGVGIIGPVPPGQVWAITRLSVNVTGPLTPTPTIRVYDGPNENPQSQIDSSYTGNSNTSDFGTPYQLQENEQLLFVWAGGTPGTIATGTAVGVQASTAGRT